MSIDQQIDYLRKNKIDLENCSIYQIKEGFGDSLKTEQYCLDTYSYKKGFYSVPQFRVYDNSGALITGWQSCYGMVKPMNYFSSEIPSSQYDKKIPLNRKLNFESDIKLIKDDIEFKNSYDIIIVVFWARYLGRFNKDMLAEIEEYKRKNKSLTVHYIYLNID